MALLWPVTIPSPPQQSGYSETVPNRLKRSQPDAGPAKVRRMAGTKPRVLNMEFVFTTAQKNTFLDWVNDFDNGLGNGIFPFEYPHPIEGNILCQFAPLNEETLFDITPLTGGNFWTITALMEVLP